MESYMDRISHWISLLIKLYFRLLNGMFSKNHNDCRPNQYYNNLEISKYRINEPLLISDFGLNDH